MTPMTPMVLTLSHARAREAFLACFFSRSADYLIDLPMEIHMFRLVMLIVFAHAEAGGTPGTRFHRGPIREGPTRLANREFEHGRVEQFADTQT
jgi:hypothetical protein